MPAWYHHAGSDLGLQSGNRLDDAPGNLLTPQRIDTEPFVAGASAVITPGRDHLPTGWLCPGRPLYPDPPRTSLTVIWANGILPWSRPLGQ